MPLLRRKAQLAVAIEATSGTAETLLAADVVGNAFDPVVNPTIEVIDRPKQGDFGYFASVNGLRSGTCTFRTELTGDGSQTAPLWAESLLPACGFVQSVQTFTPTAEAVGSNVKTVTIALYQDGRRSLLYGAAGTFVVTMESGKPVSIEWTFTGKWGGVTDASLLSPTLPTDLPFRFANTTTTIGSWSPCMQSIKLDAGNSVVMRECQSGDATGFSAALITDRAMMLDVNPEAALVATEDPYGDLLANTAQAFSTAMTDGTDTCTIAAAAVQPVSSTAGDRNGIVTDDISYKVLNDSLTFVWS